jgi:hypothetical protein
MTNNKEMMMKKRSVYFALLLVSFAFFNSCKDELEIEMDKETFEKEYSAWKSQDMKNYQFTYHFFNDAGPVGPVEITIKENEPPAMEYLDEDNNDSLFENMTEIYEFIRSKFDFIERVKNGEYDGFKLSSLTLNIKYNEQYHYPVEVNFSEGYVEPVDGGGYFTLKIVEFIKQN